MNFIFFLNYQSQHMPKITMSFVRECGKGLNMINFCLYRRYWSPIDPHITHFRNS
jgi:hypothetical protein